MEDMAKRMEEMKKSIETSPLEEMVKKIKMVPLFDQQLKVFKELVEMNKKLALMLEELKKISA